MLPIAAHVLDKYEKIAFISLTKADQEGLVGLTLLLCNKSDILQFRNSAKSDIAHL